MPSPRNSLEAHTKLLQDYRCKNFLFAKDSSISQKIVNDIQTKVDLQTIAVPTLNYFFHPGFDVPHYKYTATYEEARFQPLVAMHTSGTTGTPKTIVMPQGVITGLDASQMATFLYGTATTSDYFRGLRCFFAFPLFRTYLTPCCSGSPLDKTPDLYFIFVKCFPILRRFKEDIAYTLS